MKPFERQLEALLREALKTEPNAAVVGALIGGAIAVTIQGGRNPSELHAVLDDSLKIFHGMGGPPS